MVGFSSTTPPIRFDYQQEINEFIHIFDRLTAQTRTPEEVKQDQALGAITQGQGKILDKQNQILNAVHAQKELVLDFDWFKDKFEKQVAGVRDKFNPELHTQTAVDHHVHAILCDEAQLRYLGQLLSKIIENNESLLKATQALSSQNPRLLNWEDTRDGLVEVAKQIERLGGQLTGDFQKVLAELNYSRFLNMHRMPSGKTS